MNSLIQNICVVGLLLCTSCGTSTKEKVKTAKPLKDTAAFVNQTDSDTIATERTPEINKVEGEDVIALSQSILFELQHGNFEAWSKNVHSKFGLAISPYSYLYDLRTFQPEDISEFYKSDSIFYWGQYDASEDSILMTWKDYFINFVNCADFTNNAKITYNMSANDGNSLNNFEDFFPNAIYVDFHIEGTEEYGFMDWKTLRLGFQHHKGKTHLMAIIHNEWTI